MEPVGVRRSQNNGNWDTKGKRKDKRVMYSESHVGAATKKAKGPEPFPVRAPATALLGGQSGFPLFCSQIYAALELSTTSTHAWTRLWSGWNVSFAEESTISLTFVIWLT